MYSLPACANTCGLYNEIRYVIRLPRYGREEIHMVFAFVIWCLLAALFAFIGLRSKGLDVPAGFWANSAPPESSDIKDVKAYNDAVYRMWMIFAGLFVLTGVPLLFCRQNSPLVIVSVLATVAWCIGLLITYTRIESKYRN